MRRIIGLLAFLSVLAPLAAIAAPAATLPGISAPSSAVAVGQLLSPQELMVAATPAVKLDTFFQSMNSGSTDQFPLAKHCSLSCALCSSTCPKGAGVCSSNPCL